MGFTCMGGLSASVHVAAFPQFAAVLDGNLFFLMSVRKSQTPLGLDFFVRGFLIPFCSTRPAACCLQCVLDLEGVCGKGRLFPI